MMRVTGRQARDESLYRSGSQLSILPLEELRKLRAKAGFARKKFGGKLQNRIQEH